MSKYVVSRQGGTADGIRHNVLTQITNQYRNWLAIRNSKPSGTTFRS